MRKQRRDLAVAKKNKQMCFLIFQYFSTKDEKQRQPKEREKKQGKKERKIY